MKYIYNKYIIFLLISQLVCRMAYAFSTQYNLPECQACLDDKDTCFNDTLSNSLTIKSRGGVEYIDLNLDNLANKDKDGKGTIVEISYIIVSTKGDYITVQLENGSKNQYIIESRDSRVSCSYRKSLKFYQQNERIAVYCNNLYYDCDVKFDISLLKPEKEKDNIKMPECSECVAPSLGQKDSNTCFESIYLPVHSWYYLYYDSYESGMYLDFLVSSHKKDSMRIEVQSHDGLFYLVKTRRDKVKCSDPQISIPVRWQSPRIAVYCYNNYKGCMFSIYVRSVPMDQSELMKVNKSNNSNDDEIDEMSYSKIIKDNVKKIGYYELENPQWSEWSEWSDCFESHKGIGQRTRERKCLQNFIDFVHPENTTHLLKNEIDQLLKSSDYPYCEGPSTEVQNCELDFNEQSWLNILILFVIISSMVLSFYIERNPRTSSYNNTDNNNYEDIVKTNHMNDSNNSSSINRIQREMSFSENSPLLNTYFRRYD